jgi:glycerophosphoryl diester phosphodiesterase
MKIIGHRGARGLASENTIASLQQALEIGVDEIEVDVHVTADDVVVLSHDPAIQTEQQSVDIASTTYKQLLAVKPDLTTLEQALSLLKGRCPLIVEIKSQVKLAEVISLIQVNLAAGYRSQNIQIASFEHAILCEVKRQLPNTPLIVNERWSGIRASHRAKLLDTKRISMNQRWLWRGFLRTLQRRGFQLSPYTINSPAQARRWKPYLYGIIADYPDRFI